MLERCSDGVSEAKSRCVIWYILVLLRFCLQTTMTAGSRKRKNYLIIFCWCTIQLSYANPGSTDGSLQPSAKRCSCNFNYARDSVDSYLHRLFWFECIKLLTEWLLSPTELTEEEGREMPPHDEVYSCLKNVDWREKQLWFISSADDSKADQSIRVGKCRDEFRAQLTADNCLPSTQVASGSSIIF